MVFIAALIIWIWIAYLAIELAMYWMPLFASFWADAPATGQAPAGYAPTFYLVSACRNESAVIPELAQNWRSLDYPAHKFQGMVIADNCTDNTAAIARELGLEVYERQDLSKVGKGNALNDALELYLQNKPFDILVVMDVDARVDAHFLHGAAAYFAQGADVVACATYAKNPNESLLAQVGDTIQAFLRLHQRGRASLGLDAILYGSHGYVLSRGALDKLVWHTTTGQVAEDMELRLRSTLAGLSVRYAPDLHVLNDVTADPASVRQQRTRWNSTYLPLIPQYLGPLLRKALEGEHQGWDTLFGLLLLPAFANLFLYLMMTLIGLLLLSLHWRTFAPAASVVAVLLFCDVMYFVVAMLRMGRRIGWKELKGFSVHVGLRTVALVQGLFYVGVKDWAPAPHAPEDKK